MASDITWTNEKHTEGDMHRAIFIASFPPIQSAIKVHGHANGMRVQIEIPESEMGEATKLLLWRERLLRVTIEPEQNDERYQSDGRQIHI